MSKLSLITKGFVKDNPTFVLVLGMCPTLATTTSAMNGLEMGLATMFVLILSNIVISLVAPVVPDKVRIPVYIVIIATFVTVLQFLMQAFVPAVYETLGLFIPLIVVNCIVLGRAEAFANKNGVVDSALDGLGIGIGFTMSLTVIGIIREILGNGSVFGWKFIAGDGILAFVMAPGAFLVLGYLWESICLSSYQRYSSTISCWPSSSASVRSWACRTSFPRLPECRAPSAS